MSETNLFAVIGRPVLHSCSPQIFNSLFKATRIDAVYFRLAADSCAEIVQASLDMPLRGFNVTAPFKVKMMRFLDSVSKEARKIGAVNTVVVDQGRLKGFNTDYMGAVETFKQNGTGLKNKRVVILGAGGAACAAAFGALEEGAKKVVLVNRTLRRAEEAAARLGCEFSSWDKKAEMLDNCEVLISCVSTGQRVIEPEFLHKDLTVLDANYRNSRLLKDAAERGCRTLDGKEWLINQALPAFGLWIGQDAPADALGSIPDLSGLHTPPKPNLALIGFMGTGKTTVGRILAEKTGFHFLDIDTAIEERIQSPVHQIFDERGEEAFRRMEKEAIEEAVPGSERTVFSLGGGAVLMEENRFLLHKNCTCFWLWESLRFSFQHLDPSSRPLLNTADPEKKGQTLLKARMPLYAGTSDMAVNVESKSPEEVARRITYEVEQTHRNRLDIDISKQREVSRS